MAAHPYSPADLDLPGYVPQRLSQLEILGPYLGASLFVLLAVWLLSGRTFLLSIWLSRNKPDDRQLTS